MRKFFGVLEMAKLASIVGAMISGVSIICISEVLDVQAKKTTSDDSQLVALDDEETTTYGEETTVNVIPETTLHVEITSEEETTTVVEMESVTETTQKVTEKENVKETTTKNKATTTTKKTVETTTEFKGGDVSAWINPSGNTVVTRFKVPKNYTRVTYEKGSYAEYVRNLPLEYYGRKMYEYDGKLAEHQDWSASVIKTQFHSKGWLQCADCVMKLLGDYLYNKGKADELVFDFASGRRLSFANYSGSYEKYMSDVYMNANTSSLKAQKESIKLSLKDIFPGAYFIMDKDRVHEYGHAIFVIDVARNDKGEVAFLLAQGSTPSQDMYIFQNPLHPDDPWYYSSEIGSTFEIPGWTFKTSNLYYYQPIGIQKGKVIEEPTVPVQTSSESKENVEEETTTVAQEETTDELDTEESTTIKDSETKETVDDATTIKETEEKTTEKNTEEQTTVCANK